MAAQPPREQGLGHFDVAEKVDVELPPSFLQGKHLDRCVHGDAGVVDQGSQRSTVGLDKGGQISDLLRSSDIEDDGTDIRGLEFAAVDRTPDTGQDVITVGGEFTGSGRAHPGGGAGNDDERWRFR